jgi:hypothetical protein
VDVFEGLSKFGVLLAKLLVVGPKLLSMEGIDVGRVSLVQGSLNCPQVVPDGGADNVARCPEWRVFSMHKHLHRSVYGLRKHRPHFHVVRRPRRAREGVVWRPYCGEVDGRPKRLRTNVPIRFCKPHFNSVPSFRFGITPVVSYIHGQDQGDGDLARLTKPLAPYLGAQGLQVVAQPVLLADGGLDDQFVVDLE